MSRPNQREFETLALPLVDPLYNFARWISGDADEAQDLVQETFAKALKGLEASARAPTSAPGCSGSCATRSSRAGPDWRAGTPCRKVKKGWPISRWTRTLRKSCCCVKPMASSVRQALAMLPNAFQDVLILADLEELSYREISEALGIPPGHRHVTALTCTGHAATSPCRARRAWACAGESRW